MTESSNVNKLLENQIENMIDVIIGEDNEESSLHFSEEEEETAKDFSHIKFERVPKKYPTISFNRNIYKLNDKKLILKWKNIVMSHINENV